MSERKRVRSETIQSWYAKTKIILGSQLFFRLTLVIFVLQAGIVAIYSGFPLAFDEGYHLGIIHLHAQQLSPFFSNLPDWTGQFGALATDPSYLYHYLMSFPYRLITAITDNTFAIILSLRFINIAFFVLGIYLFRKVLTFTGASSALINLVLLAFVALPLESFTAAHINYDNLLFPMTAAALLFCLQFAEQLRYKKQFDPKTFTLTIAMCLLAVQVKYVFVSIFIAIVIFMTAIIGHWLYKEKRSALADIQKNTNSLSQKTKLLLIGLILLSSGLFAYRFGYNIIKYQAVVPDCSKVLSVEACMQYGPWARNYELGAQGNNNQYSGLGQEKAFVKIWLGITGAQLFTILDGNKGGSTVQPISQLLIGAVIVIAIGCMLLITQWRRINKIDHATSLILLVSGAYIAALLAKNYSEFAQYGVPVAIQGRYLLPILLLLLILLAQVYSLALKTKPGVKLALLAFVVVIGAQGGGIATYAIRANDDSWRWTGAVVTPTYDLSTGQTSRVNTKP